MELLDTCLHVSVGQVMCELCLYFVCTYNYGKKRAIGSMFCNLFVLQLYIGIDVIFKT